MFWGLLGPLFAHEDDHDHVNYQGSNLKFTANKGQWHSDIRFRSGIPGGTLFLLQNRLIYDFNDLDDMKRIHDIHHSGEPAPPEDFVVNKHAFQVSFVGGNQNPTTQGVSKTFDYMNYFLGDDPARWKGRVPNYQEVDYSEVYPGINFRIYGKSFDLKYDFLVEPGADPNAIQLGFDGIDRISVRDERLHIKTSVNTLIEDKPYAYQIINGKEVEVACKFKLKGKTLQFELPEGYNKSHELIIDPTLIFSSYTGSTYDNWGYTATYDSAGHLYGGGIIIDNPATGTYPTTMGAYQSSFQGGDGTLGTDIGITKFSPDGDTIIYSTFVGGLSNESPHSLVVNSDNELYVLGTTSSSNFPTTAGAYSTTFGGGSSTFPNGILYPNGSDIIVFKLDTAGANLLGSTFMGGPGNDGLLETSADLVRNYGDQFRGEIICDDFGNVYVASSTTSVIGFPLQNAVQSLYGGGPTDGVAFKLSSNLNNLLWSTYLGGTGEDAAYSIQLSSNFQPYITGGTTSGNYPTTAGAYKTSNQGPTGEVDGFISRLSSTGSTLLSSTYVGTVGYDQCYFVQLDSANAVYVVGQTDTTYPVSPNTYSNPNSGQFLHKFSTDLTTSLVSTVFGTGSGDIDIALTAFLVNDCHNIFISGWGGSTNLSQAPTSTTTGLPTTPNAYSTTTDGSDFYLIALSADAQSLLFGTFFGGGFLSGGSTPSNEHVDGGTCRFDKKGIVYHAVCAGCGGQNAYPSTPGAFATTNGSANCNLGVFKYDLVTLDAIAETDGPPHVCQSDTVKFLNLSIGGATWLWDFGDGDTSSAFEPFHIYQSSGTFTVSLAVMDSVSCIYSDTAFLTVSVTAPPSGSMDSVGPLCAGDSVQLQAYGGVSYVWTPNQDILNRFSANPVVFPDQTQQYTVVLADSCGRDTIAQIITVNEDPTSVGDDDQICVEQTAQLHAEGAVSYEWSPDTNMNNRYSSDPVVTPHQNTVYTVKMVDAHNCVWYGEQTIFVDTNNRITPYTFGDTLICYGDTAQLFASGATTYRWNPTTNISDRDIPNPIVFPTRTTIYYVDISNVCGTKRDSMKISVQKVEPVVGPDTTVCPGENVQLHVSGGKSYVWFPPELVTNTTVENPIAIVPIPTEFGVLVTDSLGCQGIGTASIDHFKIPYVDAGLDQLLGAEFVRLEAKGNGTFEWFPATGLECTNCNPVRASPDESTTYYVTITDTNGCQNIDSMRVEVISSLYIPNSFTPNGEDPNNIFRAKGVYIREFHMEIFDRWGELIFESKDINDGWDGYYKGRPAQIGTYVYRVSYVGTSGVRQFKLGKVTLIR